LQQNAESRREVQERAEERAERQQHQQQEEELEQLRRENQLLQIELSAREKEVDKMQRLVK
jgi:hypothetical protein